MPCISRKELPPPPPGGKSAQDKGLRPPCSFHALPCFFLLRSYIYFILHTSSSQYLIKFCKPSILPAPVHCVKFFFSHADNLPSSLSTVLYPLCKCINLFFDFFNRFYFIFSKLCIRFLYHIVNCVNFCYNETCINILHTARCLHCLKFYAKMPLLNMILKEVFYVYGY